MGVKDYLEKLLFVDSGGEKTNKNSTDESRSVWEGKNIDEIEKTFANMLHPRRINIVSDLTVPVQIWIALTSHIHEEKMNKWGLQNPEENIMVCEQNILCTDHEDDLPMVKRRVSKIQGAKSAQTETISTEVVGKVGPDAIGSIESSIGGSTAEKFEKSDKIQIATPILECATDDPDCISNRRSFISTGEECMIKGTSGQTFLSAAFEQKYREMKLDSADESGAQTD